MSNRRAIILIAALLVLLAPVGVSPVHAIDPRYEIDPALLQRNLPAAAPKVKTPGPGKPAESAGSAGKKREHRREASSNIGRGAETNRGRAKSVKRGRRLVAVGNGGKERRHQTRSTVALPGGTLTHRMSLMRVAPGQAGDAIQGARLMWENLVPEAGSSQAAYSVKGESFSLDLDPKRFPVFTSANGKKIVVESGGELSPLIRSLIEQREPGVRFVGFRPGEPERLYRELLDAGGFYSVEESFSVSFGTDPKLTVTSDFKVEKDQESSLQNDIFLVNATRRIGYPLPLAEFMSHQGFKTVDLSPRGREPVLAKTGTIEIITEKEPAAMVDRLLTALHLPYEKDRGVDVLQMGDGGVGLKVRADRYFERNGERYVIGIFNGDPEGYTLLRLLDSLRYKVIMLTPEDDFKRISDMILSRLHLPGRYAVQELVSPGDATYSIEMSVIMIDSPEKKGRLFLTEQRPEPVITELLKLNGYTVREEVVEHRNR